MAAIAVETIAATALRSRLRTHGGVTVRVRASAWDLLAGRVGGAKVEGRLWESPLGLTARVLDVEVGLVELDLPAVLAQQRIVLRNTPLGSARVMFDAADFGAFLQHPLITAAARKAVQGQPFIFDRSGVTILPSGAGGGGGCVLFSGALLATGQRYQLTLRPARGGRAAAVAAMPVGVPAPNTSPVPAITIPPPRSPAAGASHDVPAAAPAGVVLLSTATAGSGEEDSKVSSELSRFFSGLLVDLQGAELAFCAMRITGGEVVAGGGGGSSGSGGGNGRVGQRTSAAAHREALLELDLRATIRSFPPLNVQF